MKALLKSLLIRSSILIVFGLIIHVNIYAQGHDENNAHEDDHTGENSEHHEFKHWRFGFGIGQSLLPAGTQSGADVNAVIIPTIGIDIQYWFNPKFGLGLVNELEIISYVIESPNYNELAREYPFQIVFVGIYKIKNGLGFYLGPGIEIEKHENFFILKAGIEYELELGNHWDVVPTICYFNKDGNIGGLGVAVGFGKRF